jgi:hypothetical protein
LTKFKRAGQPTKYKEKYADQLIEYISENWEKGASIRSFSGVIKIPITTLFGWKDSKFSDARQYASDFHELFLTDLLLKAMQGKGAEVTETTTKINYKNGNMKDQIPEYSMVSKKPAKMSIAAIMFALRNIAPDRWQELKTDESKDDSITISEKERKL